MTMHYLPGPNETRRMTTDELRAAFLVRGLFQCGAVTLRHIDLDRVVLGGGLGDRLGLPFVQAVQRATHERLFVPEAPFSVVPAALGDLAGARGAALLAGDR